MADQSDVENALATLAAAALYPSGPDAESLPGPPCRIYRGWPNPAALDADLAAGRINVTIFAGDAAPHLTTRFSEEWASEPVPPTLHVSVSNTTVTFTGVADTGQLAGVLVDRQPFVYRTRARDTPSLVAATLGSLLRTTRIVRLQGASIEIPGAQNLVARVVTSASALKEVRRQSLKFRITCWCPSPDTRDATAAAIDSRFAASSFIPLADTSKAWVTFAGGAVFDQSQNASLYRRDLLYSVEYATTVTEIQPQMLFGVLGLNASEITT
jgi:hypothetical protein